VVKCELVNAAQAGIPSIRLQRKRENVFRKGGKKRGLLSLAADPAGGGVCTPSKDARRARHAKLSHPGGLSAVPETDLPPGHGRRVPAVSTVATLKV